jgi:hypothetical protein
MAWNDQEAARDASMRRLDQRRRERKYVIGESDAVDRRAYNHDVAVVARMLEKPRVAADAIDIALSMNDVKFMRPGHLRMLMSKLFNALESTTVKTVNGIALLEWD